MRSIGNTLQDISAGALNWDEPPTEALQTMWQYYCLKVHGQEDKS